MNQPTDEAVFDFLDELRESGATNMFGAGRYIEEMFNVERRVATQCLTRWMQTFSQRHPKVTNQ